MSPSWIGYKLLNTTIFLNLSSPIVLRLRRGLAVGPRRDARPVGPDRLRLLGLSSLVFLSTNLATSANAMMGINQAGGLYWNWVGKLACLVVLASFVGDPSVWHAPEVGHPQAYLRETPRFPSLSLQPFSHFWDGVPVFCAARTRWRRVADVPVTDAESCRGTCLSRHPPGVLSTALGSPWKLGRAQGGVVVAGLFAAVWGGARNRLVIPGWARVSRHPVYRNGRCQLAIWVACRSMFVGLALCDLPQPHQLNWPRGLDAVEVGLTFAALYLWGPATGRRAPEHRDGSTQKWLRPVRLRP